MMHRTFSRLFRGSYGRKWIENNSTTSSAQAEVPQISSEFGYRSRQHSDRRRAKESQQFNSTPKHSLDEAFTLTAGLALAYQLTNHHRKSHGIARSGQVGLDQGGIANKCPITASKHLTRSILGSSVYCVRAVGAEELIKRKSIDVTPFLKEEVLVENDNELAKSFEKEEDSTNFEVQFSKDEKVLENDIRTYDSNDIKEGEFDKATKSVLPPELKQEIFRTTEKLTGDLMSLLGVHRLMSEKENIHSINEPPIHALELLKKGTELGSCRAMYNIAVAYDRMNNEELAREYYKKSADLGHPLGAYNSAIMSIRSGDYAEGKKLMQFAAREGIAEAKYILRQFNKMDNSYVP